jgi:hypothetical protein
MESGSNLNLSENQKIRKAESRTSVPIFEKIHQDQMARETEGPKVGPSEGLNYEL